MTNRFMLSVAAAALIAGAGFANAQGTGSHQGASGSTAQQSAPSSGAGGSATQGREESGGSSGMKSSQSEQKSGTAGKNQRADETRGQKSNSMSSENERGKGGKDMKAEGRQDKDNMKAEGRQDRNNMKAEGREDRDHSKSAAGREDRDHNKSAAGREDRDRNMKAEGREGRDRDRNMSAEGREGRNGSVESRSSTTTTGQAGAGAKLSTEQRTKITSVIREQHVKPVENVNFSISVGTRVPRSVSFHTLPSQIVTIYPEWRGYEYFLVRDQIVVVDPKTLEIVAVLEA